MLLSPLDVHRVSTRVRYKLTAYGHRSVLMTREDEGYCVRIAWYCDITTLLNILMRFESMNYCTILECTTKSNGAIYCNEIKLENKIETNKQIMA